MRKLYFIVSLIILATTAISCEKSKEEILISDYTQTIGKAKMDLNFKMINLEKIRDITAKDSAEILKPIFEETRTEKLSQLTHSLQVNTMLEFYQNQLEDWKQSKVTGKYKNERIEYYEKSIVEEKENIENSKKVIEAYKTDCKGTFLEPLYNTIQQYEEAPDKLLATEYNATYTIENPMLNNAKQEINTTYLLNGDRTEVLSTD